LPNINHFRPKSVGKRKEKGGGVAYSRAQSLPAKSPYLHKRTKKEKRKKKKKNDYEACCIPIGSASLETGKGKRNAHKTGSTSSDLVISSFTSSGEKRETRERGACGSLVTERGSSP